MRGLPLNGYIIFYQFVDNNVEIIRVINGRQDLVFYLVSIQLSPT